MLVESIDTGSFVFTLGTLVGGIARWQRSKVGVFVCAYASTTFRHVTTVTTLPHVAHLHVCELLARSLVTSIYLHDTRSHGIDEQKLCVHIAGVRVRLHVDFLVCITVFCRRLNTSFDRFDK
jgi:hypothetical protein